MQLSPGTGSSLIAFNCDPGATNNPRSGSFPLSLLRCHSHYATKLKASRLCESFESASLARSYEKWSVRAIKIELNVNW